jgi:hypothetical protein
MFGREDQWRTYRITPKDTLQKYFNVDLVEFYSCVAGFLNLRDKVIQQISDQTIGELIKNSELYSSEDSQPTNQSPIMKTP